MNEDVIPSFYETRAIGATDGSGAFENVRLRYGEVKRVVHPDAPASRSKRFIEYDVLVPHRENDTAVTKLYQNCLLVNPLGGLADYEVWTLRPSRPQPGGAGADDFVELGLGSKVLLLCINGEHAEAVILGGIRDERSTDVGRKARGHHYERVFNGVTTTVEDDGSWQVEVKGKTADDGTMAEDADKDGAGTKVRIGADGTWQVSTAGGAQSITINHKAGTVEVNSAKKLTLLGDRIEHGRGADQHGVCGDVLVSLLEELLDAMMQETHYTPVGTSSPPLNAPQYAAIRLKLRTMLSDLVFLKKSPR